MAVSLIVAASENGVIGNGGQMPWHLPADLAFFKKTTTGHCLIMGRGTFESLPGALPNRKNIVITRNRAYKAKDALVVPSIEAALAASACDDEPFIAGGAQLYRAAASVVSRAYITRIHTTTAGDATFDFPSNHLWELVDERVHAADEKNKFAMTFQEYRRRYSGTPLAGDTASLSSCD